MDFNIRQPEGSAPDACSDPDDFNRGRLIKQTSSICPACLEQLPARVYERDRKVWMDKQCGRHGRFSALLSSSITHYYKAAPRSDQDSPCCGSSCGLPAVSAPGV